MRRPWMQAIAIAGAAVVSLGVLAACGSSSGSSPEDNTVQVDTPEGGAEISSGTQLAADFPSDVPLPDGMTLIYSQKVSEGAQSFWNVTFEGNAGLNETMSGIRDQFTSAGFEVGTESSANDVASFVFQGKGLNVTVTGTTMDGTTNVGYIVAPLPS